MGLERKLFLFLLCPGILVFGIVIDPQSPGSSSKVYVQCLTTNEPIQIKDPFRPSQFNDEKLISMEWYQYKDNGTQETMLLEFLRNKPAEQKARPKFTVFEFWGLQINNVEVTDSAEYRAKFVHLSQDDQQRVKVVVARPPALVSERLSMSRKVNQNDKSVTLSCGQLSDLGSPPVNILLKAENGTVLPTVYSNGAVEIVVSSNEADTSKFTCEIDLSAPAASCINSKDLPRWQGVFTEPVKLQQSDMIGIIVGVVAAVVVLIIIIVIIIVIVWRRRRRNKTKTYDTQEQEEKRSEPHGNTESLLRDYENPYDKPYTGSKPIYKGPPPQGPYMVSRISEGNEDADSEYEEMDIANGNSSKPQQNSGLFIKRGDEKEKKKQEKEVKRGNNNEKEKAGPKPPQAKPRSIFLTPSMEELDRIGRAVAGGEGSQPSVGPGTQV